MRVFHLCAGASVGGAENAFIDTCVALHAAGLDIQPICRPHPTMVTRLQQAGMRPITLPFGGLFDWTTAPALRALIKAQQPAIIQTWMNRAARFMPTNRGNLPLYIGVARLGGYYKLKYYKAADHFITNTPDIGRYLRDQGIAAQNITHINNFVPIDDAPTPALSKADLGAKDSDFVFLTLSRLHPVKGIDLFLKAMARLPDQCIGWIAGEGPERPALEKLVQSLGIAHRVRFLGWRDDRMALLKAADALVFPSRFEPFGNSFAQAWAAQCPVITTNSDGPRQYVRDGEDALVSPIDDVDQLVQSMNTLSNPENKALRAQLVLNGSKRFAAEFTQTACVNAYQTLYARLAQ